jgi:hypothetical protein
VIPITVYPPAPFTYSGDNITASRFANTPDLIARALQDLGAGRYIGNLLLPSRVATTSGSIGYEVTGESIFAVDAPTVVAPGSEYQLTTVGTGTIANATVAKSGQDTIITDEAISRLNYAAIVRALTKLVNSQKLFIDSAVIAAVASAVTATAAATAKWDGTGSTPTILKDILKAQAAIRNLNLGYEANLLLVGDNVAPYLMTDATLLAAMAREDRSNPVYTGRFPAVAGLEIMTVPASSLPGGVDTAAWLIDRGSLGFILTENLGGGYQSAGDLVETKSYREEGSDGVRVRVRSNFKAVVTDPGAGYKITTVL